MEMQLRERSEQLLRAEAMHRLACSAAEQRAEQASAAAAHESEQRHRLELRRALDQQVRPRGALPSLAAPRPVLCTSPRLADCRTAAGVGV